LKCFDIRIIIKNYESYVIKRRGSTITPRPFRIRQLAQATRRSAATSVRLVRASSSKPQATSNKPQAPSDSSHKPQASSPVAKASSFKPQASSAKIPEPGKSFTHPEPRCWTMIKLFCGCFT